MKTAIQTPLVTLSDYIASRSAAMRVNPVIEGRKLYWMVTSLVLDNPFSDDAKTAFPVIHKGFSQATLTAWAWSMNSGWLPNLSRRDRNLFYSLQFKA